MVESSFTILFVFNPTIRNLCFVLVCVKYIQKHLWMRMYLIDEVESTISINFSAQWDNPIEIEGILCLAYVEYIQVTMWLISMRM